MATKKNATPPLLFAPPKGGQNEWTVTAGYSRRMAAVWIKRTEEEEPIYLPLAELWRRSGIDQRELGAIVRQSQEPIVTHLPMDGLRAGGVPSDCTGMTVLDIGGWDGFAAELALKRGAARAICLDSEQWREYTTWEEPTRREGVEYVKGDFRDWNEPVDWVLFYNVLYHVEDPRGALQKIHSYTRGGMTLSTISVPLDLPVWVPLYEREWLPDDPTDYWVPSESGLIRMLEITGWKRPKTLGTAYDRIVVRANAA